MTTSDEREAPPAMAGVLLRVARETAGLSIDAVAQQLKLAPRQVKALEEGDYTHLPGRTFVRGFVRNYARLLHLDPDRVLGALPAGAAAPALEAPTLQQTAPTIGELPTTDHSKAGWARWAIPLVLAAIVAAAAIYEWRRPAGESHATSGKDAVTPAAPSRSPSPSPTSSVPNDAGTRALSNPLAGGFPATDPAHAPAPEASAAATPPPGNAMAPAPTSESAATGGPALGEQALVLAFRDYSWTEVRDRDGRVLMSRMNAGGTAQSLSGTPPLVVVIGNAADVTLRYKGEAIDLAPHTRQNVARLTLP